MVHAVFSNAGSGMSGSPIVSERGTGAWILLVAAAAGLGISVFNYFWTDNGIHGSAGALLVVISSLLMFFAVAALLFADGMSRGLRSTLVVLIVLDISGTALAAYMLEADWLVAVMAVALLGWIIRLVSDRAPRPSSGSGLAQRDAP